ncbi:MAG: isochorismate synthase, partial [Leptolyngbyaceae bacterium]|nr:isochorismate synthase [Leptolyngbyaceae bacterium]
MPVKTQSTDLFRNHKDLYQFLAKSQQVSIEKKCTQILSISLAVEPVEPLAVLYAYSKPHQLHFYIEQKLQSSFLPHPHKQGIYGLWNPKKTQSTLSIAAIDTVAHLTLEGSQRFAKAKDFIDFCLENTLKIGDIEVPYAGPHFFCNFTFFDHNLNAQSAFPPATIFLPRWQISRQKDSCILVTNIGVNPHTNLEDLIDEVSQECQTIRSIQYSTPLIDLNHRDRLSQQDVTDTDQFKSAALDSLNTIKKHQLHKVVLAHAIDVTSPIPLHPIYSLNNLRQLYPDCYVFSTSNGRGQSFIGASPERLISMRESSLITDALAGSAPRGKTMALDAHLAHQLLSSQKERYEHRVVVDFIVQHLQDLGLTPDYAVLPQLLRLSNIQHLHTPMQAQVPRHIHPLEILGKLHPTPAVAGVPRESACEQIRAYETFERGLYAAPLGWVDYRGNCEFIVGIRSALMDGYQARLYAGAGIVAGSNPNQELAEIQL